MPDPTRDTVLKIYDTVANQALWPDVLDRVARRIDARGCVIIEWPQAPEDLRLKATHFSGGFEAEVIQGYIERCAPWEVEDWKVFERLSREQDEIDLIDDSVLAPTLEALKQRPNVQALQRFGLLHRAGGLLNKDNKVQSRFSIQYGAERGRPTGEERRWMSEVLPHIAKALELGRPARELAEQKAGMLVAIDRLAVGVCVLDSNGCVVVKNTEFDRQLAEIPAFRVDRYGKLFMNRDEDQALFASLCADAMRHGRHGARPRKEAIGAGTGEHLCIEVIPLDQAADFGSSRFGGCVLYSQDPSVPMACDTGAIQRAYGLTDAELQLVDLICEGLTNAQIAERRDRSISTINSQVKSILAKTDCATRTQFVRLTMSFGGSYLRGDD